MSENTRDPTVDNLRVKLCYICLEEEHYDSPPDLPPVWTHPCKCTLIAHESCLLHWINTQQRDFGRSRNEVKCPQCCEFFEFVDYDPTVLAVLSFVHRTLSRSNRIVTWINVCAGAAFLGASVYLICVTYGALAMREFLGPDMFNALLTADPTLWPRHAWVNLPLIPFSLIIITCMPSLWTTHPLVPLVLWIVPSYMPLLSPWPVSPPVGPFVARSGSTTITMHPVHPVRLQIWPPPPKLLCMLFPHICRLYRYLLTRVTRALVHGKVPARRQLRQVETQEQLQRRDLQERLRLLRRLRQRQQEDEDGQRQRREQQQQQRQVARQEQPRRRDNQERPAQGPRVQQERRERQQQERQPEQRGAQPNHYDFGAVAAALAGAIRVMDSSLGRLICGALVMPIIARMMGAMLLNLSHVVPFVRIIIAWRPPPLPPPPPPPPPPPIPPAATNGGLLGLWDCTRDCVRSMFGLREVSDHDTAEIPVITGGDVDASGEFSTTIFSGLLATSQEWATSDPVWWRNALGLCVFLVVKDGLEILRLRLANAQLERKIKSKPFSDVDLTRLDLIERHT